MHAVEAVDVSKCYGSVTALDRVSVTIPYGSVFGLLGHNGAGKSTLIGILATLARPNSGRASVAGYDVVRDAHQVRRRIGVSGQYAAVDEQISARDNLILVARLLGASRRDAKARAIELTELFDLENVGRRPVRTYSGGMRRRLDLAVSVVGRPKVVFLDEPTTGLDPTGRLTLWRIVRALAEAGSAVLLSTQYLDEADRLADRIAVLSKGRVVTEGPLGELKHRVGGRAVALQVGPQFLDRATTALRQNGFNPMSDFDHGSLTVPVPEAYDILGVVRALDRVDIAVQELRVDEPSLDDVYAAATRESQVGNK